METAEKFVCIGCPSFADHCYPETRNRCSKRPLTRIQNHGAEEQIFAEYKLEHFDSGEFSGWSDYKFLWALGVDLHPDPRK